MPRLTPQHWKNLEKVFTKDGFVFDREESSHRVYVKPGCIRPIIIPKYSSVGIDIIKNLMKTAGMDRERYFKLLAE
ncbi:MAG: type II toxin-antitoxin system HicA family toxin [Syntrophorhabdaceae bacterium]